MENIVDIYYEKLSDTEKPGNILARFFGAVFDVPATVKEIIMFNKLIRVYGKYIPFFAVLDMHSYENADITNPFGLLSYYCKKRLEDKTSSVEVNNAFKSLDSLASHITKRIEEQLEERKNSDK